MLVPLEFGLHKAQGLGFVTITWGLGESCWSLFFEKSAELRNLNNGKLIGA